MSDPVVLRPSASAAALGQLQPLLSETVSEKTTFIWEIHDHTFPTRIIPEKLIVNPKTEPDRDTSVSILDFQQVQSSTFIRGQGIGRPSEWQLQLQYTKPENKNGEMEAELVLVCHRLYSRDSIPVPPLWAKVAYEIIDESGSVLKRSGDVSKVEPKLFREGTKHEMSLGTKSELQSKSDEYLIGGVLRFRVRMNIYKELSAIQNTPATENDYSNPPAKRRRLESPAEMSLTGLLGSLDNLWTGREQSGNVTIKCAGMSIKAHKFILSSRSSIFMKMLDSLMETKERETMEIEVADITGETMNALLEFLYLGDSMQFDWFNMDSICELVYAAEKYHVIPLKNKCYDALLQMMTLENFWKVAKATFMYDSEKEVKNQVRHFYDCHQITLNGIQSFRTFAHENFDEFYKLFFHRMSD